MGTGTSSPHDRSGGVPRELGQLYVTERVLSGGSQHLRRLSVWHSRDAETGHELMVSVRVRSTS